MHYSPQPRVAHWYFLGNLVIFSPSFCISRAWDGCVCRQSTTVERREMERIAQLEEKITSGRGSAKRQVTHEITKAPIGREAMAAAAKQHALQLRPHKGRSRASGKAWTPWDVLPQDPMGSGGGNLTRGARQRRGSRAGLGSKGREQGLRNFVELVAQAHGGSHQKGQNGDEGPGEHSKVAGKGRPRECGKRKSGNGSRFEGSGYGLTPSGPSEDGRGSSDILSGL
jgi:hypothetical protein